MRLSKQIIGERLVATALYVALVLAVSFWVPDWIVRGFGVLGIAIVVLLGVLAIIADTCMAWRSAPFEDAHELSTMVFPPSDRRSGARDMD